MSVLARYFDVVNYPKLYGPLITAITAIGFVGTCPIWYKVGKEYEKIQKAREAQKEEEEAKLAAAKA